MGSVIRVEIKAEDAVVALKVADTDVVVMERIFINVKKIP